VRPDLSSARLEYRLPFGIRTAGEALKTQGVGLEQQTELEGEVATLIAEAVNLETPVAELDPNVPLFGDGLGLDSIDVLEIALAVSKKYGFQLRSDDPANRRIFASLRSLTAHIEQHRTR
jgi:acyl carrier protein